MDFVNLNPRPSLIVESLRSVGYSLETALADIIDNSITADADHASIQFMWAGGAPWVAIIDNGHGMPRKILLEAMRFGSTSPLEKRSPSDLGRFGLGMKTASISQCRKVTVVSKAAGELSGCTWDLDRLESGDGSDWRAFVSRESEILAEPVLSDLFRESVCTWKSGTIVLWQQLDSIFSNPSAGPTEQRFSEAMDGARRHLETVFHRFLAPEIGRRAVHMDFNGNPLMAFDPFGPRHPARQELPLETIRVQGHRIDVQAYVLPHHSKISRADYEKFGGEQGYLQNQGFYVYRNRRLIVKATWFRLMRKEELSKLIRVRIDISNSLDHLWKIDVKKSQADPPEPVRRELRRVIQRIAGTGRRVYTKRATRLMQRSLIPVWKREVVDGKIRYALNEEHPLLIELLRESDEAGQARIQACFRLISASFPSDLYFSDAANDAVEFAPAVTEQQTIEVIRMLIEALRKCGLEGESLRRQVLKTESLEAPRELVDRLIEEAESNG